jgi:hypothetical protein
MLTIEERVEALERRLSAMEAKAVVAAKPSGPVTADDTDLDSEWGNFEIRKDPARWKGKSYVGKRLSETEPQYLECMADFKTWLAGRQDDAGEVDKNGKPKSYWAKKDAARALGWAERLRNRMTPGEAAAASIDDGEIPF